VLFSQKRLRGENLEPACVMLERTVRLEPKKTAFLDTLWA